MVDYIPRAGSTLFLNIKHFVVGATLAVLGFVPVQEKLLIGLCVFLFKLVSLIRSTF